MSISSKKVEQITNYYIFHKQIECIFNLGANPIFKKKSFLDFLSLDNNNAQNLYVVDKNWINCWKKYSGYNLAYSYLEKDQNLDFTSEENCKNEIKEICNNMILMNQITESEEYKPPSMDNESYGNIFIHKLILNLEDFDCLVDEKTFNLFQKLSSDYSFFSFEDEKTINFKGILLEKMIILLIKNEKKMKFIFYGGKSNNMNLLQLTADFTQSLGIKPFNVYGIFPDYSIWKFETFFVQYTLKKNSDELIQYLTKEGIEEKDSIIKYTETDEIYFVLYNDKKYIELLKNNKISLLVSGLDNIHKAKFIGLNNVGATCYMNATLQCLINIDALTRFLLKKDNYIDIVNNMNLYELTSCYCELLLNVCCYDNIKSYSPNKFKEIISRKNPLFQGVQANDSKDLINFLLEEMNNELKNFKNTNTDDNNNSLSSNPDQTNKHQMLEVFKKMTKNSNKSIISIIFFILMENITKCSKCYIEKYNYQVSFFIEFPLETIYNFCNSNNIQTINYNNNIRNNKICIPIFACFEHFRKGTFFTGDNKIYCDRCRTQNDAMYLTNLYSLPPTLILILNRGKGNSFDCDVDFPQNLNLKNYVQCDKSNYNYKLRGVITHLGESGMGGHFIAYCRHRITDEWYCYNDSICSLCQDQENDFRKGTPYILFYDSTDGKYNFVFDESAVDENDINKNNNMNNIFNNSMNNPFMMNNYTILNNMMMNNMSNNFMFMNSPNIMNNSMFIMNNNFINSMNNASTINNINNLNNFN